MSVVTLFMRADQAERRLCMMANSACRQRLIRRLFKGVSRLGDGIFWYALIASMPLWIGWEQPRQVLEAVVQMSVAGVSGLLLYKWLKQKLVRERPFIGLVGIECAMPPLDRYSFPSGHTLHAVCFTLIAIRHVPELAVVLVPFALLVAMSRVVLGLHYPTDVMAGALLGALLAVASSLLTI
jgi:undecaprenyl-diphosphatase